MKQFKRINRKMVEAALIMKQINGEIVQRVPHNVKLKHVYCASFKNNVICGIAPESFYDDIIDGDGGELCGTEGSAPKFNSISSSTALAVSTFAPWKKRLSELSIELGSQSISGFERLEFEHIAKTAIPKANKHPNLDVWLESDNAVLAIECKFCEFLNNTCEKLSLNNAYKRLAAEMGLISPWVKAIDQITNSKGECKYQFFNAVQIIRHYFGIINSDKTEKHLLYLYWHPDNEDWNLIPPFNIHEEEMKEFAGLVAGDEDVQFHFMSFNDLWDQWRLMDSLDVQKQVRSLEQEYSIAIQ